MSNKKKSEHDIEKASYTRALKSSSIMGGAAAIQLLIGMIRTKFVAVLIGVVGIGLLANYIAIQGVLMAVSGLGIRSSAVRDIAIAVDRNDSKSLGRIVVSLRRVCRVTGLLGALVMVILSPLLSQWTFGDQAHTWKIALLGISIFLSNISDGQQALIQGMQKIGQLARINVISAVFGALIAMGLYTWLGVEGIIPALILTSFINLTVSWIYARSIPVPETSMTWMESFRETRDMLRLGLSFMWMGILASAALYLTNLMLTKQLGLEAVGLYTAAFALSLFSVKFVLQAMSYDYYPRLAASADNKEAMNRIVNEQTEIGLLLATPGILGFLSLAPWIIQLLYTTDFIPAAPLLQWFILGCLITVIQWPMGYILVALGKAAWYSITMTLFTIMRLGLIWLGLIYFGLEGASIAYALFYVFALVIMMGISHKLTGFVWTPAVYKLVLIIAPIVVILFLSARLLPIIPATIIGVFITAVTSLFCLRGLIVRVGLDHQLVRKILLIPGIRTFFK